MRTSSRLAVPVALALAFGATAALAVIASRGSSLSQTLASGSQTAQAVTPRCVTTGLRISVGPGEEASAVAEENGSAVTTYTVDFTNETQVPCALAGYPQVATYTAGMVIGGGAGHLESAAAHPVLLGPGQTAHAVLDAWTSAPRCRQVRVAGLRIIPPGESVARYVPHPLVACAGGGQATLQVDAIAPGPGALPRRPS